MFNSLPAVRVNRSRNRSFRRGALLTTVSVLALVIASPRGASARPLGSAAVVSAPNFASDAATAASQQAAAIARQSQSALTRATQAIQAMQAAQNAARNAAAGVSGNVPNGLAVGGLQVAPNVGTDPTLWQNAKLPTQTGSNGQTTVTIQQTAPQALLNWQTFNVGKNTTIDFNQQGNASWVALNKISDPSGVPSQILGQIKAAGQVYLINRNGIIFGGSSQVNVGTLVASALPINDALLNAGTLFGNLDSQFTFSAYAQSGGSKGPTAAFMPEAATAATQNSKVMVEPGAIIATSVSSGNNGGRVILIGPQVENKGSILTPDGQTILAAGQQVALMPHISKDSTDPQASLRGFDVDIGSVLAPATGFAAPDLGIPSQVSSLVTGTATNSGLIEADRGNITIAAATVNQLGAALSTTSASLNGRIDLSANYSAQKPPPFFTGISPFVFGAGGVVTLGANSLSQIMPELSSTETVVGTSLALPSQVNINGLAVYLGQNAQIYAPSGQVKIATAAFAGSGASNSNVGQIYVDRDASIDVSGSINVPVPVTDNVIAVQLFGAQLADSPLQRSGPLHGQTIFVDVRQTGTNADGSTWIGTPLADATGYVNLIQRTVGELTIGGGSITLNAGQSVVLQQGSILNVSGGWINYQGGTVKTTVLVGSDGRLYGMANANPNISYVGVAGQFKVDHRHWGVTDIFTSPLIGGGYFQPSYIQGGSGGSISIQSPAQAIDGQLLGLTVAGPFQRQILFSSPILNFAGTDITALLQGRYQPAVSALTVTSNGDFILQAGGSGQTAGAFTPGAYGLASSTVVLPSELTSAGGIGALNISAPAGNITIKSDITGQAGGSITLSGNNIDVEANVTLPGGSIKLATNGPHSSNVSPAAQGVGSIMLGSRASLNVAGLVVDDRTGSAAASGAPLAINGGSVSLTGYSLNLESGSTIDVSGGLALSTTGKASNGNGGSIGLADGFFVGVNNNAVEFGDFVLGSTLKGYGVGISGKGGTLSLQAPGFQIGGAAADRNTQLLSPSFFNQGGFANFVLTGFFNGVIVAANTAIKPVVQSYQLAGVDGANNLLLLPTTLPEVLQSPVSLQLLAPGVVSPVDGGPLVAGRVVVERGASITLASTSRGTGSVTIGGGLDANHRAAGKNGNHVAVLGSIIVPGGTISIASDVTNGGEITTDLAPGSLLSTAGTVVPMFDTAGRPLGTVLAGGSITLTGNTLAEPTAVIDVSGASGTVNRPANLSAIGAATGNLLQRGLVATRIDSDGGSLTLSAADSLFIAATLRGDAGGPTALGGSLSVSGRTLQVSQNLPGSVTYSSGMAALGSSLSGVPSAGNSVVPTNGLPLFAVDSFSNGHFDSLTLGGSVIFSGPVTIAAKRDLTVATGGTLLADSSVTLSAPHVALGSKFAAPQQVVAPAVLPPFSAQNLPIVGSGSLTVAAGDLLDVGGLTLYTNAFTNLTIGSTSLTARNDIRGDGTLQAVGNVTMTAGQIYPVTGTVFTIAALDTPGHSGSVTFAGTGMTPQLALSAGGELNVFATTITQDGVLRAPLGTINLGFSASLLAVDATGQTPRTAYNASTTVTLGAGSITSVSAVDPTTGQGLLLPYGLVPNGTNWTAPSGQDITNGGPPGKAINVTGANIATARGATVDLSGGGDFYGYNFVKGLGGSKDILASSTNFAIIPGYQADFAPVTQIANATGTEPGWSNSNLSVGDQITLAASTNGLAAGTYTLLPARYAMLPGAFLVTPRNVAANGLSVAQPDGSSLVSGARFNGLDTSRQLALQPNLFEVDSTAVVRARAEYDNFSANSFFAQKAAATGTVAPRLPIDAGILALNATTSMILHGAVTMSAPPGGLGGVASIVSTGKIVINDTGTGTTAGTLFLSAPELSNFGADTLVIGGTFATGPSGATLTAKTASIEVNNDSAGVLSGPDLVLVSSGLIKLDDNADIEQRGNLANAAQTFLIGSNATGNSISGNGSLLRVSSDTSAAIVRADVTPGGTPNLKIGANARISGNGVILDTTGSTFFDATGVVTGQAVSLGSGRISLQLNNPGALQQSPGLVLPTTVLTGLQSTIGALSLLSYSQIDIYGSGAIGGTDAAGRATVASLTFHAGGIRGFNNGGGTVTLNARNVTIDNSPNAAAAAPGANSGTLLFNANTVTIGTNAFNVVGYGTLGLSAPNGILVQGSGSFATAGDLTATTALITGAAGASQTITAGGALTVNGAAGSPVTVASGLGAMLTLTGASVTENSAIVLPSGNLTLHAIGGDVTVGGTLDAGGTAQLFFDHIKYTSGGQINLTSDSGSVMLNAGSVVSVAAPVVAGNAGSLAISATNGDFDALGSLMGQGGSGGKSGAFNLDVGSQSTLGALDAVLNNGGFQSRTIRVRSGDVIVDGNATTQNFSLSADSGMITVTGTIDASGVTGGQIGLFAYNGVTLANGSRLTVAATQLDKAGKGGLVDIETDEAKAINGVMTAGVGWIDVQAGSEIRLSVAGGPGGVLHLRAPQITGVTGSGAPIPTLVNNVAGGSNVAIKPLAGSIVNPSSIVVEGFQVFDLTSGGGAISQTVKDNVNANGQNFAAHTATIINRLFDGTVNSALRGLAHVRPGEELVTQSGDMTLAAGSDWNFNTYRYGPNADTSGITGAGEPGVLTLRAAGNLILLSSLTDGFTPTSANLELGTAAGNGDYPYDPTSQRWMDVLLPAGSLSWSYRLTAGADLHAADFHRVVKGSGGSVQLGVSANLSDIAKFRSVLVTGNGTTIPQFDASVLSTYYQVIRTGTGDIDVAAAGDVQLLNPFASIYTAGTQVTPVATSTVAAGGQGTISLANGVPLVIPNELGVDTITSTTGGTITYRLGYTALNDLNVFSYDDFNIGAPSAGGVLPSSSTPGSAFPKGTVFTFPSGYVIPFGPSNTDGLALHSSANSTLLAATGNSIVQFSGSISGLPVGTPINIGGSVGQVVIPSSSGSYTVGTTNAAVTTFSAGVPITLPGGALSMVFNDNATHNVALSGAFTGSTKLTVPSGSYTLTGGASFVYLPPGATLTPLDTTGGGLFATFNNYVGLEAYAPSVSVVATIPLAANTPFSFPQLPAGMVGDHASVSISLNGPGAVTVRNDNTSVILPGNSTGSPVSIPTAYSTPSVVPNATSTSYAFDTPVAGGASLFGVHSVNDPPPALFYPAQYSTGGGNVTITAGRDIIHQIGTPGNYISDGQDIASYEMPNNWLYRSGSVANGQFTPGYYGGIASTSWWIDFSNFTQGVGALGGGNVTLNAGRDIKNVAAVVPTNAWMPSSTTTIKTNPDGSIASNVVDTLAADQPLFEYGGGNLAVTAGRDISGGVYYVEKGDATLTAGRAVTTNAGQAVPTAGDPSQYLPTTLFLGKGNVTVTANGSVQLGQVANALMLAPGYLNGTWNRSYFSTYAATDTVDVSSLTGAITLSGTGQDGGTLGGWFSTFAADDAHAWLKLADQSGGGNLALLMPPVLRATAFTGDINVLGTLTLAPAPSGTIDLAAGGSINGFQQTLAHRAQGQVSYQTALINVSDANPAGFPSVAAPLPIAYALPVDILQLNLADPRHEAPILSGFASLITETGATQGLNATQNVQQQLHDRSVLHLGDTEPGRLYAKSGDITGLELFSPKFSNIFAGRDIADISLYLQNLSPYDTSSVIAGRDIVAYSETTPARLAVPQTPGVVFTISPPLPGDISIGGPGTLDVFAGRNLSLGNAPAVASQSAAGLGLGIVSIGDGRNPFLPASQGATITAGAGIGVLGTAASGSSPNYAAFIDAFINPATAGNEASRNLPYLATLLGTASDSAWAKFETLSLEQQQFARDVFYRVLRDSGRDHNDPNAVNGTRNYEVGFRAISTLFPGNNWTGDISLTGREIKTAQGGDINLLAPGGQLLVGFDLGNKLALDQGVLTLESGNINIFANNNVAVGSSRIFTFRGGDETIWSTTGNIAAGSASKTLVSAPPARFAIDPSTGASTFDPSSLATGGGIGVLQTVKGAPPGNVDLIAPTGFVDAGDAGIRVSGNLNIAALFVLNASNIQVGGTATGVPVVAAPNIGGLTAANNAAGAAAKTDSPTGSLPKEQPSIIIVEVLGYGGGSGDATPEKGQEPRRPKRDDSQHQDPTSPVQVIGAGDLSPEQRLRLSDTERRNFDEP